MTKYGQIAQAAADHVKGGMTPQEAWEEASCDVYPKGSPAQRKGCPRNAFLGLNGVNPGNANAQYALAANAYLDANPSLDIEPKALWDIVMDGDKKKHNNQMDVVLALRKKRK